MAAGKPRTLFFFSETEPWLAWNLICRISWPQTQYGSDCLCLLSAGVKGVDHNAQQADLKRKKNVLLLYYVLVCLSMCAFVCVCVSVCHISLGTYESQNHWILWSWNGRQL